MSDEDRANLLGSYLRARRALVTPEQAGLPAGANRRVPGLRREEVAMLAGISADYYLRLERGRDPQQPHSTSASLASSDGSNSTGPIGIHRVAPRLGGRRGSVLPGAQDRR